MLELPCDSATTVPTATHAPTTIPILMTKERARRCFGGAITAPEGLDAVTPRAFSSGAAAVPTGCAGSFTCWFVAGCSGGFCVGLFVCACGSADVALCAVVLWPDGSGATALDCAWAAEARSSAVKQTEIPFLVNPTSIFIGSPILRQRMRGLNMNQAAMKRRGQIETCRSNSIGAGDRKG